MNQLNHTESGNINVTDGDTDGQVSATGGQGPPVPSYPANPPEIHGVQKPANVNIVN